MSSNAISGIGTVFSRWNSLTSTWDTIAEVTNITGPGMSRETIDVTSFDSSGGYREFIAGLRDGGDISFNMNFTAAGYQTMKDDFESDTRQDYSIQLPDTDNTTFELEGLVTELPLDIPLDDKISCDVTIKISGETTISNVSVIEEVETLVDINAAGGTQLAGIGLASTVEVTLDDGHTENVAVSWDTGTPMYDGDTPDTYTFVGTLSPISTIRNPNGLTATVDVIVAT